MKILRQNWFANIIALAALVLSILSLSRSCYSDKKIAEIKSLEKRTIVLVKYSEIILLNAELQNLISLKEEMYNKIEDVMSEINELLHPNQPKLDEQPIDPENHGEKIIQELESTSLEIEKGRNSLLSADSPITDEAFWEKANASITAQYYDLLKNKTVLEQILEGRTRRYEEVKKLLEKAKEVKRLEDSK